jgi:16S rRNA (guanine527-N7)-methyltransferase
LTTTAGSQPPLEPHARRALEAVIELLATDPTAPSAVVDPERAWRVHVADSLSGLGFEELSAARRICDIGSGAGFPGLVLAAARPHASVTLLEAASRKCEFMRRAVAAAGLENAEVVGERAETWASGAGAGAYDAATARAVGRLSTIAELASPLLAEGGVLVAWKGRRDPGEEAELERAAPLLAMEPVEVRWVGPYAGSENRHLHLIRKSGATPPDLPRRPGVAKKRPRGSG